MPGLMMMKMKINHSKLHVVDVVVGGLFIAAVLPFLISLILLKVDKADQHKTQTITNTYRWQGTMVVFVADDLSIVPDVKIGLRGDGVVVWTTNATKYGQP